MLKRMTTVVATTFIVVGGGLYLGHPLSAEAAPCGSPEEILETTAFLINAFCGGGGGNCSFICSGGEPTSFSCNCG